jgi:hypothetical protein
MVFGGVCARAGMITGDKAESRRQKAEKQNVERRRHVAGRVSGAPV